MIFVDKFYLLLPTWDEEVDSENIKYINKIENFPALIQFIGNRRYHLKIF